MITTKIFKYVSGFIKMSSDDQSLKSGDYGETCVSYKMQIPDGGLGIPFTQLEVIDRYDCADGVILGSRLVARDERQHMVLAEIDALFDENDVVTTFIDDEHDQLDLLKMQRENIIIKMVETIPVKGAKRVGS